MVRIQGVLLNDANSKIAHLLLYSYCNFALTGKKINQVPKLSPTVLGLHIVSSVEKSGQGGVGQGLGGGWG